MKPNKKKFIHMSVDPIHGGSFYLTPTIQLDLKPMCGHKLHIRVFCLMWVLQIEFIGKNPKKLGEQFLA